MKATIKTLVLLTSLLGMSATMTACTGGGNNSHVVVVVRDGYWGYYNAGNNWCTYSNNYCGTGTSYGIIYSGGYTYYNGCDYSYACYSSYPGYDATYYSSSSYYTYNNGYYTYNYSAANGSGNGYYYNSGSSYNSGYTSNGSGNGSTYYNSGSSYNSGSTSNGSGNGYYYNSGSTANGSGNGSGWSTGSDTTDTDLQLAQAQNQDLENRANALSTEFQMSVDKARELAKIADKVQALGSLEGLKLEDRDAITNAALSVVGIQPEEVNKAVAQVVQSGDQKAVNDLLNKAAKTLGMPDSAGLREKLLPALGIQF